MGHSYLIQGETRWCCDNKIQVIGIHNGRRYNKMRLPLYWEMTEHYVRCCVRVGTNKYRGVPENNNGAVLLKLEKCYRLKWQIIEKNSSLFGHQLWLKRDGTNLTVKLVFHLVKVGMPGHLFVNVEKIIAHSNLLEKLKIWLWWLNQDH